MPMWLLCCFLGALVALHSADSNGESLTEYEDECLRSRRKTPSVRRLLRKFLDHHYLPLDSPSSSNSIKDFNAAGNTGASVHGHGHKPSKQRTSLEPNTQSVEGKLVGGQSSLITQFPYQLQLGFDGFQYCGASVLSEDWAVTAAHCMFNGAGERHPNNVLTLRSGTTFRDQGGTLHRISNSIMHGLYDHNTRNYDYDITLLRVSNPFTFSPRVQPIALPSEKLDIPDGTKLVVSGWGDLHAGSSVGSKTLQHLQVLSVNQRTCNVFNVTVTDRMICAGVPNGAKNACQGDSGGPLSKDDGLLIGIVSWGPVGCNVTNLPAVYTRVSGLRGWIRENTLL